VVVVVVVVGAHRSWQFATQAGNTTGLVGHCEMHTDNDPPGQSSGAGEGDGVGGVGAAVVVVVTEAVESVGQVEGQNPYSPSMWVPALVVEVEHQGAD